MDEEDDAGVGNLPEESSNKADDAKLSHESTVADSCQLVADGLGIELLQRKAASYLSREVIFKVKLAIQHAERFRRKARRARMSAKDINDALVLQSGEGVLGITCRDFVPLKGASGIQSSNDIFGYEEKEIDLNEILQSSLPKYPAESHLKCHWLVVDGKQPCVPENPLLLDRPKQNKAALSTPTVSHGSNINPNLSSSARRSSVSNAAANSANQQSNVTPGAVKTKPVRFHELSLEQQLYFKEITEACMGMNEERKSEALASLSTDPGIHSLLPRFSAFIAHGVRLNVLHRSLAILIYLMRMLSALINNPNISLEKYLHELVPSVFTCIVNRQLVDQHWALRGFAAKCLASLCDTYSNNVNNLLPRSVNVLNQALNEIQTIGMPTLFGVTCALGELGNDSVQSTLLPHVKTLGILIQDAQQQVARREHQQQQQTNGANGASGNGGAIYDSAETEVLKKGARELQNKVTKVLANYINSQMPELVDFNEFKTHYGHYLGPLIYNEVSRLRNAQSQQQSTSSAITYVTPSTLRTSPSVPGVSHSNAAGGVPGAVQRHNAGAGMVNMTSQHQPMRGVPRVATMQQGRHVIHQQAGQPQYFSNSPHQVRPHHQTFANGSAPMTSPPDSKDFQISPNAPHYLNPQQQLQPMISPQGATGGSQISPNGALYGSSQHNYSFNR